MLPELPVAGPSPAGPVCPSTNYMYHATIAEEAGHLLSRPNDALASQLGIALGSTSVDHIVLNAKNVSAFTQSQQPPAMTSNTSHLQGTLYRRDQALFTPLNRQQQVQVQQQQQRWNNNGGSASAAASTTSTSNYSPNYGHNSPASMSQGGFNQQQQQQNMYNMAGYNQFGYQQQQSTGNHHMMSNK